MLCSFNLLGWVDNVDIPYILEISTDLTSIKKPNQLEKLEAAKAA